jgi:hypothetical protein
MKNAARRGVSMLAKREAWHPARGMSLRKNRRLLFEPVGELGGRHVDVPKNLAERARLERAVAMHGHDGIDVASVEKVMAAANAEHREPLALQKTQHFPAARAR